MRRAISRTPPQYRSIILISLAAFAAFSLPSARAQTYLYNRAEFLTGTGPTAVVAADFNGDGRQDLAVANQYENAVSILLGKPDASYAPRVDYAAGLYPHALVAADFSGDGRLDLGVVSPGAGTVSVLIGNGDGTFQTHSDHSVGSYPVAILAADFNGDQRADLAVLNKGDSTVSILLGVGDGTFEGQRAITVDTNPVAMATGDFNVDGKPDLVTANNNRNGAVGLNGTISVLLGAGDGTFGRVDEDAGYSPAALAVGVFNSEGKSDVVVAGSGSGPLILFGNGDGTFQSPVALPLGYSILIVTSVAAGDFNHDSRFDLAFASDASPPQPLVILLGNGDGTFQAPLSTPTSSAVTGMAWGDFNSDGAADVALSDLYPHGVSVLLGNGDATFGTQTDVELTSSLALQPGPLLVADFDGDNKLDAAAPILATATPTFAVVRGNGDGTFQPAVASPLGSSGVYGSVSSMAAGDFNSDQQVDVAVVNTTSATVSVLLGNGDATFQPAVNTSFESGLVPRSTCAGDFDRDGRLDLAVTLVDPSQNTSLLLMLGNGDGTFRQGFQYAVGPDYASVSNGVVWGDFNGDLKLDLAVIDEGEAKVLVFAGVGNGSFLDPVAYAVPFASRSLAVGDFDGDGKVDLAVGSNLTVSVRMGNGDGTFGNPVDTSLFNGGGVYAIGDINGDGKLDAVIDGPGVLLGNGDGTFQISTILANFSVSGIGTGDFNSDGIADVAFASTGLELLYRPTVSVLLSAPFISLFPPSLSFGSQQLGLPSPPQGLTLTNIGNSPLSVSEIVASGDFQQSSDCNGIVDIASACTIQVTFTPSVLGSQTGSVVIANSSASSPSAIPVTGAGIPDGPIAALSTLTLVFGGQVVGVPSNAHDLVLTNSGGAPLNVASVSLSGASSSDFAASDTCGSPVPPQGTCTISVTFTPSTSGARNATLIITDDAADSPQTVALTGTGTDFTLAVGSGSSTSATVTAGQTATYALEITPAAGFDQSVAFTCAGAPQRATCAVLPGSVTLSGTEAASVTVNVVTTARSQTVPPAFRPGKFHGAPLHVWLLLAMLTTVVALAAFLEARKGGACPARGDYWRRLPEASLLAGMLLTTLLWAACGGGGGNNGGGGGGNPGTPAGTYTLTVTGTYASGSATLQRTLDLTLNVN